MPRVGRGRRERRKWCLVGTEFPCCEKKPPRDLVHKNVNKLIISKPRYTTKEGIEVDCEDFLCKGHWCQHQSLTPRVLMVCAQAERETTCWQREVSTCCFPPESSLSISRAREGEEMWQGTPPGPLACGQHSQALGRQERSQCKELAWSLKYSLLSGPC